jgi:hypothetical protein
LFADERERESRTSKIILYIHVVEYTCVRECRKVLNLILEKYYECE